MTDPTPEARAFAHRVLEAPCLHEGRVLAERTGWDCSRCVIGALDAFAAARAHPAVARDDLVETLAGALQNAACDTITPTARSMATALLPIIDAFAAAAVAREREANAQASCGLCNKERPAPWQVGPAILHEGAWLHWITPTADSTGWWRPCDAAAIRARADGG